MNFGENKSSAIILRKSALHKNKENQEKFRWLIVNSQLLILNYFTKDTAHQFRIYNFPFLYFCAKPRKSFETLSLKLYSTDEVELSFVTHQAFKCVTGAFGYFFYQGVKG
ncbi:MAG TPA: hypothetical protein VGB68_03275 [Pyrinomonadaceae bacterium]|jgi:hypothetical protein